MPDESEYTILERTELGEPVAVRHNNGRQITYRCIGPTVVRVFEDGTERDTLVHVLYQTNPDLCRVMWPFTTSKNDSH